MELVDVHALGRLADADLHGVLATRGEGASLGEVQEVDGRASDGLELLAHGVERGDGAQQALGVLVLGVVEDLLGGAALAVGAGVHDHDLIAHLGDDAQVVGDHDDGHAQLLLERLHELEDLGLDGDVERRGGLVGDQDIGLARERHGDHDALAHAAGVLVRVLLHALLGVVDADEAQHLDRTVPCLPLVAVGVERDGLDELVPDGVGGVQRGHRVLEDDRDLVAAHIAHDLLARTHELLPVELDGTGDDLTCGGEDLHDGVGGDGLAGTGLAHDAEDLAPIEEEGDAVDGLDLAGVGEERRMEVGDFEQ